MSNDLNLLTRSQELHLLEEVNLLGSLDGLYDIVEVDVKEEPSYSNNFEQQCNRQSNEANVLPYIPVQPSSVISNEEYLGPLNFEVFIGPHHGTKTQWVFSGILNKVFIAMLNPFPVDFKWLPTNQELFVRATPLFSLASHVQELVLRCIPHALGTDSSNLNVSERIWDHVIRCKNSNAVYQGDKTTGQHLSVVVPLGRPQNGTDTVRHMFIFMCKNSCPTGMNRKPFEVVFTLEDEKGEILGRSKVNIRVCSCPKRDKEKEEKEFLKSKDNFGPPPGKKRRENNMEKKPPGDTENPFDATEYTVNLKICGKHNYQTILKYAHDLMAGEVLRHDTKQPFLKYVNDIKQQMNNLPE